MRGPASTAIRRYSGIRRGLPESEGDYRPAPRGCQGVNLGEIGPCRGAPGKRPFPLRIAQSAREKVFFPGDWSIAETSGSFAAEKPCNSELGGTKLTWREVGSRRASKLQAKTLRREEEPFSRRERVFQHGKKSFVAGRDSKSAPKRFFPALLGSNPFAERRARDVHSLARPVL